MKTGERSELGSSNVRLVWFGGANFVHCDLAQWRLAVHPETIGIWIIAYLCATAVVLQLRLPIPEIVTCAVIFIFFAETYCSYIVLLRATIRHAQRRGRTELLASPPMILTICAFGLACVAFLHELAEVPLRGPEVLGVLIQWWCIAEGAFIAYGSYVRPRILRRSAAPCASRAATDLQPSAAGEPATASGMTSATVTIGTSAVICTELRLIQAEDDYLRVYRDDSQDLIRARMKDVVPQIPDDLGVFVHRSYWVAFTHIRRLRRQPDRQLVIDTNDDRVVPIARGRQQDIIRGLSLYGIYTSAETEDPPEHAAVASLSGSRSGVDRPFVPPKPPAIAEAPIYPRRTLQPQALSTETLR